MIGSPNERSKSAGVSGEKFCEERQRLLVDLMNAIHNLSALYEQQTHAVVDGDSEFSRFDILIHAAREAKDAAKYAWIEHIDLHQCSGKGGADTSGPVDVVNLL